MAKHKPSIVANVMPSLIDTASPPTSPFTNLNLDSTHDQRAPAPPLPPPVASQFRRPAALVLYGWIAVQMTAGLMRKSSISILRKPARPRATLHYLNTPSEHLGLQRFLNTVAHSRATRVLSKVWFTSATPRYSPEFPDSDRKPPNERIVKLGKTIRILHERLPTLLVSPLPQEILSPQIKLHLFPSTHPHLPTVTGRIAYTAALWTAPIAWGRVPMVGNVKLDILSERMVKNGPQYDSDQAGVERLIVKWKTCGKSENNTEGTTGAAVHNIGKLGQDVTPNDEDFVGLFIFEFDGEGRIVTHTIEHAEEGGSWDKTTRVISVTDWLLGRAWGKRSEDGSPGLALAQSDCATACRRNRRRE